jgi:uncharacterized membrane protein YhiD involved in acid resistance
LRLTIIVLIAVLAIGGSVIVYGFMMNHENYVIEQTTPYEKLQNYKEKLERINQYNQKVLSDLEQQITNSDNANLEQLNDEIDVLKGVIHDNKAEIEQIIQKLSKMESNP